MKKVIILGVVIFAIIAGYFLVNNKENNNQIQFTEINSHIIHSSKLGFDYTPPEGWELWEGFSAVRNASLDESFGDVQDVDNAKLQDYLNKWNPVESEVLIYTSASDVDLKSRDVEYIGLIGNRVFVEEEKPLVFNIFRIEVFDTPINYVTPQKLEDREISKFESPNVSGEIQVVRGYRSEDDLLLVSVPFGEKTILITRSVKKGANGGVEDMVKGISFDK